MKKIYKKVNNNNTFKNTNVFTIIYCEDAKPFEHYDISGITEDDKNLIMPAVLLVTRYDGTLGFPGGRVEKGESPREAAIREIFEELNIHTNISEDEYFTTFCNETQENITYLKKTSYEFLKTIQKESVKAMHAYSENIGTIILPINDFTLDSIPNMLFAGSAKEELQLFIDKIIGDDMIERAYSLAKKYFEPKLRNNGNNYFDDHILKVYEEGKKLDLDKEQLTALLLHDMYEDTDITKEYMIDNFGKNVERYVDLMTIRDKDRFFYEVKKATDDPKVRPLRFADRYSNLKQTSIKTNSVDFIKRILYTTENFYIPNFKGSFKYKLEKEVNRLREEINKKM